MNTEFNFRCRYLYSTIPLWIEPPQSETYLYASPRADRRPRDVLKQINKVYKNGGYKKLIRSGFTS
jgi:hypothetical protein